MRILQVHSFAVKAILLLGAQRPRLLEVCTSKGHRMSFPLLQKQLKGRGGGIKKNNTKTQQQTKKHLEMRPGQV